MKDSQRGSEGGGEGVSISRRIMKDSQLSGASVSRPSKYIKANNERFSTTPSRPAITHKYIKANNERFSTHTSCTQ